ncbi:MAG TPA: hypothetical protein VMR89_00570 [Actinomycetota bacterium]|nr:hypothetical protein [Actinomycetota bacterium]
MEHRVTFGLVPEAASRARAVLNDELGRAVSVKVLEDATLLVSELVTNAIRHAPKEGRRRWSFVSSWARNGSGSSSPTPVRGSW